MRSKFAKIVLLVVLLSLTAAIALHRPATAESGLWTAMPEATIALRGERRIIPQRYLTYQLNLSQLEGLLATAPLEFTEAGRAHPLILPLPLPDGTLADFALVESPIMEPELAAKFPTFKTYAGRMVADPTATVRLDVTLHGFHAMMITSAGSFFIDPYSTQDTSHYIVYAKNDYERETVFLRWGCWTISAVMPSQIATPQPRPLLGNNCTPTAWPWPPQENTPNFTAAQCPMAKRQLSPPSTASTKCMNEIPPFAWC